MVDKTNLKHKKVIISFILFAYKKNSFALYVLNISEIGQSVLSFVRLLSHENIFTDRNLISAHIDAVPSAQ